MKKSIPNNQPIIKTGPSISGWIIWSLFFAFILLLKFKFHELWKDEWQAWMISTKILSLSELLLQLPHEGHPGLWYLILRSWNNFNELINSGLNNTFQLQFIHALLGALACYIFIIKIRLNVYLKIAISLSFYVFYEYGIINRGYILVILFGWLAVFLLSQKKEDRYFLPGFALSLLFLTQCEISGCIIAGSFIVFFALDRFNNKKIIFTKELIIPIGAYLTGLILFYLQLSPNRIAHGEELAFKQMEMLDLKLFLQSFQSLTVNVFWPGTFDTIYRKDLDFAGLTIGLVLFVLMLNLFRKDKAVMISFLFCFLAFLLFTFLFYIGGPRQWGNLVFAFFCFYVIYKNRAVSSSLRDWPELIVMGSILFFQLIHSFIAIREDIKLPFSNSKKTAEYISKVIPEEVPIIAINKGFATPVMGYCNRSFYNLPEAKKFWFFDIHDWAGKMYLPSQADILNFKRSMNVSAVVVIYNKPLPPAQFPQARILRSFNQTNIRNENYYLYRF